MSRGNGESFPLGFYCYAYFLRAIWYLLSYIAQEVGYGSLCTTMANYLKTRAELV